MIRIEKLVQSIPLNTAVLVTNPIDIYYLTGLTLSAGSLVVRHEGSFLLVDGRYIEACKESSPVPAYLTEEGKLFQRIQGTLIVDQDQISYGAYLKLEEEAKKAGVKLKALSSFVTPLRAIKDANEIALLKEAADLGSEGFDFASSLLKEGITEEEVACELDCFWRKKGSQGVAFEPIIAFGANSAMPHYRASTTALKRGDIALIDIGVKWKHYHSDMTRVVFFGEVDPKLKTIHAVVKQAVEAALSRLKPGILSGDLDLAARQVIVDAGYGDNFTHNLGHGVGLEIHEFPFLKKGSSIPLQEGMVVTIEPGIYLPHLGGVRLEDTVVITKDGYENLTKRDYIH